MKIKDSVTFIIVYVDDILIAAQSIKHAQLVEENLERQFTITKCEKAKFFLGMRSTRHKDTRTTAISQTVYIERISTRFDMKEPRPARVPI